MKLYDEAYGGDRRFQYHPLRKQIAKRFKKAPMTRHLGPFGDIKFIKS